MLVEEDAQLPAFQLMLDLGYRGGEGKGSKFTACLCRAQAIEPLPSPMLPETHGKGCFPRPWREVPANSECAPPPGEKNYPAGSQRTIAATPATATATIAHEVE